MEAGFLMAYKFTKLTLLFSPKARNLIKKIPILSPFLRIILKLANRSRESEVTPLGLREAVDALEQRVIRLERLISLIPNRPEK
jgi:hypothetical protein